MRHFILAAVSTAALTTTGRAHDPRAAWAWASAGNSKPAEQCPKSAWAWVSAKPCECNGESPDCPCNEPSAKADAIDKPAEQLPRIVESVGTWVRDPRYTHINRWSGGKIVGAWFPDRSVFIPYDAAKGSWGEPTTRPRPTADEVKAAGAVLATYPTVAASSHAPAAVRFAPIAALRQ